MFDEEFRLVRKLNEDLLFVLKIEKGRVNNISDWTQGRIDGLTKAIDIAKVNFDVHGALSEKISKSYPILSDTRDYDCGRLSALYLAREFCERVL